MVSRHDRLSMIDEKILSRLLGAILFFPCYALKRPPPLFSGISVSCCSQTCQNNMLVSTSIYFSSFIRCNKKASLFHSWVTSKTRKLRWNGFTVRWVTSNYTSIILSFLLSFSLCLFVSFFLSFPNQWTCSKHLVDTNFSIPVNNLCLQYTVYCNMAHFSRSTTVAQNTQFQFWFHNWTLLKAIQ